MESSPVLLCEEEDDRLASTQQVDDRILKGIAEEQIKCIFEPRHEKTNILVSDLIRQKPGCTATEDGWKLESSDLESRGIVLCM